jgi:hypothetical protein
MQFTITVTVLENLYVQAFIMAEVEDYLPPTAVAIVIYLFCIALLCAIMGKRKEFNLRDYQSFDVEAAA